MEKKGYPAEVRLFARGLYLQGNSFSECAREVKSQFPSARCNAETIRRWCLNESWDTAKGKVSTAIAEQQEDAVSKMLDEHRDVYNRIRKKGELELDDAEVRSASEAASLIDLGAKGERFAVKELVSIQFVKAVLQIISEEVIDEATRRRIAARLRELGGRISEA